MDDRTLRELKTFQNDLAAIVGPELARTIVNYAQRPNELEAEFLRTDGFAGLADDQKRAVLDLIAHYAEKARR